MEGWSFLTNHARVLLRIAQDPGARLRDIAADLGITERSAYGIVTDLTQAGYVVKQKDGRRNRYQIQAHLPLPDRIGEEPAIGDVLATLMGAGARQLKSGHGHQGSRDDHGQPGRWLPAAVRLGGAAAGGDVQVRRRSGHLPPACEERRGMASSSPIRISRPNLIVCIS